MASPTIPWQRDIGSTTAVKAVDENIAWTIAKTIVSNLASLKITVTLLAFGIFIIFMGTLAQARMDMWEVMERIFRTWICFIPIETFFPPAWFPSGYLPKFLHFKDNVLPEYYELPWGGRLYTAFPFPGGNTIGVGLFINLGAAYLWHFRIQAKSVREILAGVAMLIAGLGVSLAVVWSGHSAQGLQAEPLISWGVMWAGFQILLVLGLLAAAVIAVVLPAGRPVERFCAILAATLLGALLFSLYITGASLSVNPASVRILWQIGKGVFAGVVLLGAGLLLYHKRGGVVTMHLGVAMLMFGEFFVSYFNNEEQMRIEEGRTVNYAMDIRSTEVALIDASAKDVDNVIAIPQRRLTEAGEKWIVDEALPCEMKIEKYAKNSVVKRRERDAQVPEDYRGLARFYEIEERPGAAGAEGSDVNIASVLVSFRTHGGKSLGTYLLTQMQEQSTESLEVGDTTYQLALRFQRNYKPYEVELQRVRKDDYLGTDTPRNYSSDILLTDGTRNLEFQKHVWMNNPLRYAGETFYQSGYHQDKQSGRRYTTLSVVTNRGWMIPYLACGVVMVGMLAQFLTTLYRFLGRYVFSESPALAGAGAGFDASAKPSVITDDMRKPAKRKPAPNEAPLPLAKKRSLWLPVAICAVCALWPLSKAFLRGPREGEMDINRFGALPAVFEGRAKPFDSLARNTLKKISKTEEVKDAEGRKLPAVEWYLEVISGRPEAEERDIFRVEDPDVRETLGLTMRSGQRYSINDMKAKFDELDRQAKLAGAVEDPKNLSRYQRNLLDLYRKLQVFVALRQGNQLPKQDVGAPLDQATELIGLAAMQKELPPTQMPLAVPTGHEDEPWEPLGRVAARLYVQALAVKHKVTTPAELAAKLVPAEPPTQMLAGLIQNGVQDEIVEIMASQSPQASDRELQERAQAAYKQMPEEMRQRLDADVRGRVLANWTQMGKRVEGEIGNFLGTEKLTSAPNAAALALVKMLQAYKADNAANFNAALDDYAVAVEETPPAETNLGIVRFEQWYNFFMPYYTAAVLYIIAFLLICLGWMLLSPNTSRAGYWVMILGFTLHTVALLARIYISGRPPVTNLYSSAIFIGWALVLLTLVLEKIFPLGIAGAVGAVGGFLTLQIAYFLGLESDTFTVMQAVLDTQFWLATHVVCITLGYMATFAAGALGVAYVLLGLLSPVLGRNVGGKLDSMYGKDGADTAESVRALSLSKLLATMIYGILCFALFFSLVGTVLGGLWADDSWGRFWGWDPKENGALIIVMWNVIILHCRWDKMVRDRGLAVLAIVGNIVTSWSWFGVNELNIGLHKYGPSDGKLLFLGLFVLSQLLLVGVGLIPKPLWRSFKNGEPVNAEMA